MSRPLRRIGAAEFARRLRGIADEPDKRFAFFIGAGGSVSSKIPAAGSLVRDHWVPRLRDLRAPHRQDLPEWAREALAGSNGHVYDPDNPAASYGAVIQELFLHQEERQREIERLCEGCFPAFGYAVLAGLMAMDGGRFNIVLTTNFDDLVADALYLFTAARPLVIHHESLANFIRPTRTRPLVVKLHGDHRLSPQNTSEETARLKEEIEKQIRTLLHDRGLVFLGYGGNDQGIKEMLEGLPPEALPLGVYWLSRREPECVLRDWLESRDAVWVETGDFDQAMHLIRDTFGLPHPERIRFDNVFENYSESYQKLSAPFLANIRKDYDRPEEHYRRALEADPKHARHIGTDPKHANHLGNYAGFLLSRGRHENGLAVLDRALAAEGLSENPALAAECWFYGLVHRPPEQQTEALEELKAILSAGGRSPGWDLGPHLAQAKARGRADMLWLEKLAAVISDGADIATLDGWEEWSRAS